MQNGVTSHREFSIRGGAEIFSWFGFFYEMYTWDPLHFYIESEKFSQLL
jgi:hypothetical protein